MKEIDFKKLDGYLLETFLIILEESSVSRAAERMGLTQSTVSHSLARLRGILGDPLFVRSGQGLIPTEIALSLKGQVLEVLDNMKALTEKRVFDPGSEKMHFVVAANDMQRDLIFPDLLRHSIDEGIDLSLEVRPSGIPSISLLRDAKCDLMITPRPPEGTDLFQQKLISGRMMCFYDKEHGKPPETVEEYMQANHIDVRFVLGGSSSDVFHSPKIDALPKPKVTVSNFSGVPRFVTGTDLIATEVEQMHQTVFNELEMTELPFETLPVSIFMVWHERSTNDPAHKWLRAKIKERYQN